MAGNAVLISCNTDMTEGGVGTAHRFLPFVVVSPLAAGVVPMRQLGLFQRRILTHSRTIKP